MGESYSMYLNEEVYNSELYPSNDSYYWVSLFYDDEIVAQFGLTKGMNIYQTLKSFEPYDYFLVFKHENGKDEFIKKIGEYPCLERMTV